MGYTRETAVFLPENLPEIMIGKIRLKVRLRKDHIRKDGKCMVYIQLYQKKLMRLNLDIYVRPKDFDDVEGRVRKGAENYVDHNLIIEQKLADINRVEVTYRLSKRMLSLKQLIFELENPTAHLDFIKFFENALSKERDRLDPKTYRQQRSVFTKLRNYRESIPFHEIDHDFIRDLRAYMKHELKNAPNTITSMMKTFKKFLHIANDQGIMSGITYDKIKVEAFKPRPIFLMPEEVSRLVKYSESDFVNPTHLAVLKRFLFSCWTGIRISDSLRINEDNIIGDHLVLTSKKTYKLQRIPLTSKARSFLNKQDPLFNGEFTGVHINRMLKEIAKVCGIKQKLTFHVSRHTFATNYLLKGGNVVKLQRLLGHSEIKQTMVYVHIVDGLMEQDINNLDDI